VLDVETRGERALYDQEIKSGVATHSFEFKIFHCVVNNAYSNLRCCFSFCPLIHRALSQHVSVPNMYPLSFHIPTQHPMIPTTIRSHLSFIPAPTTHFVSSPSSAFQCTVARIFSAPNRADCYRENPISQRRAQPLSNPETQTPIRASLRGNSQ
jgi:hypothetical protein